MASGIKAFPTKLSLLEIYLLSVKQSEVIEISKIEAILVVPFYNEAKRLDLEYWKARIENSIICYYFVDDGSKDGTLELLLTIAEDSSNSIKVLHLPNNVGKAEALRFGLARALGENPGIRVIGYCDGDSTVSDAYVRKLIYLMENDNFDSILASRVKLLGRDIHRTPSRHFIGRIIVTVLGVGHKNFPYDPQNGLKLFKNSVGFVNSIAEPFKTRWFVDIELMLRVRQQGMTLFWEEPLLSWKESEGSHLSFRSIPRILYEIIVVRRLLRRWI